MKSLTVNFSSIFALCLTVNLLPVFAVSALTPEERATIVDELRVPIQVHLTNGQTILGHSIDISGESIQIASAEGAGEVIYTFDVEKVDHFTIPGESYKTLVVEWLESGNTEDAFELMQLLYLQRVKILPLLPASESHFFIYYVDLILKSENPARAIAVSEILRPQISNTEALHALDDAILDSYNTLQLYDEARPLTQAWLKQRNPYENSALGYYTHGADLLRNENYEAALESALQPIVFSAPTPPMKLEHCYAVAISAAIGLRDKNYALTLYQEMQERQLKWPSSDPTFEPYFRKLNRYLNLDSAFETTIIPQDSLQIINHEEHRATVLFVVDFLWDG